MNKFSTSGTSALQPIQDTPAFSVVIVEKPAPAMSAYWYELKAGVYAVLWYRLQLWFDACHSMVEPMHMELCSSPEQMAQGQELEYRLWLAGKFFGLQAAPLGIRAREYAQQELNAMSIPSWMITGAIYGMKYWTNWREKFAARAA